jgi:hypothetical protein
MRANPIVRGDIMGTCAARARVDGREVVGVFRDPGAPRLGYFVELTMRDGAITLIRDFRYVPYITVDAEIQASSAGAPRTTL